jgi:hypothetical protein
MIGNYIKAVAAAVSRSTAQLMKTGQTTSYRTGDDGDIEAGRNTSFTVLAENNPFGNTNRFTDELGTQTYTNNIVIDWSTYDGSKVLGWYRVNNGVNITWANAIDGSLLINIAPFITGWRLPNINELSSLILRTQSTNTLNYSPINIIATSLWSSTSSASNSINAWYVNAVDGSIPAVIAKTTSSTFRYIPCRTFTVTGTTLS